MKKIIFVILLLMGVYMYVQPPAVHEGTSLSVYTAKDKTLESKEEKLTTLDHVTRLFHFKDTVQSALQDRIPNGDYVSSRQIPTLMKEALVATEDRRFYEHGGVDMYGVLRALYVNLVAGRTVEGGSTITQQLVKNLFLSSERTLSRKVEEMVLSLLMEHYYTKDEIITMYLNSIYYGNQYYGIKEATQGYFGVPVPQLDVAEVAMLAGLPQAPTYYNPYEHPEAARDRRNTVLSLMVSQGVITQAQVQRAKLEPLTKKSRN